MKLKFRLSILVIAILAVVVVGVAVVLLNNASGLAVGLNTQIIDNLGNTQAAYWAGREDTRMAVLRTIANVFADFEETPPAERRDKFDDVIKAALAHDPNFITIYTVWKPNALDGMDAAYIGRVGSTATGQYAVNYSRENGPIEVRATGDVDKSMAYFNGPNSKK